jgi:hypothetical protein
MFRSFNEHPPRAATSAVAYLDERRARRLGIGAQLQARDRAGAQLGEAVQRYERQVLAWYPLGRHAEERAPDGRTAGVGRMRGPDPKGSRHGNLGRNSGPA